MKKISIITINYNDKEGLEKTILSVLNQTYQDFEFIIIDGGSTDGSRNLIEKYSNKISYWVSEPDKGVYNAMNKGIRASTGDFVIFMNGGDYFNTDSVLEEIIPLLNDNFDIYYGDNYNSRHEKHKIILKYPEKLDFSFFYSKTISHQSTFIRKKLFDEHFYYNEDYKISSDWDFFIYTICYKNVPYKYLDKIIAVFDCNGISYNPKFVGIIQEERSKTLQKYFPAFIDHYEKYVEFESKRYKQFLHIKEHKIAWKILKGMLNILILCLPKDQKK
jgi:glycosyltransferase involved in cell wall biosynthesis